MIAASSIRDSGENPPANGRAMLRGHREGKTTLSNRKQGKEEGACCHESQTAHNIYFHPFQEQCLQQYQDFILLPSHKTGSSANIVTRSSKHSLN